MRQASRRSWRIGQTRPVKVVFMSYRNTLQADALKLVAKKLQSSLAVEGELPEDGLAAYGDDGDDLMMALARKIVSGDEEDETETVEEVFAQARDAEASAEEYLVDDDWKAVEVEPEAVAVNGNGPTGPVQRQRPPRRRHRADGRAGPEQRPRNGNGHAAIPANGNGPTATTTRPTEPQQSLFSWAEFMAEEPVKPRAGAARPRPRHCPCSSGRWNRSGRKSRSAQDARPQGHGRRSSQRSGGPPRRWQRSKQQASQRR